MSIIVINIVCIIISIIIIDIIISVSMFIVIESIIMVFECGGGPGRPRPRRPRDASRADIISISFTIIIIPASSFLLLSYC